MRIGLNLLHAMPSIGGVWSYVEKLVSALGQYDKENDYVCFVTEFSRCLAPETPRFILFPVPLDPRSRAKRVICENTRLQSYSKRLQLDLMHWFGGIHSLFTNVPNIVTIHDMLVFEHGESFPFVKRMFLKTMMKHTAKSAAMLAPVSNATSNKLEQLLGVQKCRMRVIPPIIDESFFPRSRDSAAQFRSRHNLPTQFWLYVADFYPHKNHLGLLRALLNLKKNGFKTWPLVLRGDWRGNGERVLRAIAEFQLQDDILFLPRLSDEEFPVLYSAASALIYPTLYEGAGIPVLEAMACGCPVAANSIPACLEIGGDAGVFFNSQDSGSLEGALVSLQDDHQLRDFIIKKGIERAKHFRPQRIVSALSSIYKVVATYGRDLET
jgi:glycosyltransferase involved in cell wall biosynthesis